MARKLKRRAVEVEASRRREERRRERRVRAAAARGEVARVPFRVADTGEVLRHLVRLYHGPLAGLNEIVTNGADSYREAKVEGGRIFVRVRRRLHFEVVVEDFSNGMTRTELAGLPQRVAASQKRELQDPTVVGSKGIGLFGALAVGMSADVLSRHAASADTWRLRLAYDRLDEGAEMELVARGGLALPGTRVVIRDVPETAQKVLTPQRIARHLAEQKREALRAGLFRIFVIDEDRDEQTEVLPAVFRGVPLGVHEVRTQHGTVTFDLYAHATPGERRVEVIGRGGNRLLADLAAIEAFRNNVWPSGHVEGTATYLHLEPTTGRSGVFQDARYYPQFVRAVRQYEPDVRAALERLREEAARRLSGKINEALRRVYQQVLAEIRPETPFAVKTAVAHAKGAELDGQPALEQSVPATRAAGGREGESGGDGASRAIDQTLPGRARGRWRAYPTWYADPTMPPDGPRSRYDESKGAIYVNTQHPDYLAAKAERDRGDARPLLIYQMGLLWKEYLLATDPFAEAARQADDLVGLVTRSQRHLPARL